MAEMKKSYPKVRFKSANVAPGTNMMGVRAMYDAGGHGRRADGFSQANGWSMEYLLGKTLDTVQRRVLHEVRNNPITGRIVDVITRSTLMSGPKPKIKNEELRKLWKKQSKKIDANCRLSFDSMLALVVRDVATRGEVFARFRSRTMEDVKNGMVEVPFQVQLVPSEQVPLAKSSTVELTGDAEFRSGIIFKGPGQRDAYVFLKRHPRNGGLEGLSRDDFAVVPAQSVLHVYQEREPGQLRGEPWLVRSIIRLKELDELMDAELVKKKFAAKMTTFYKAPQAQASGAEIISGEDDEVEMIEDEFVPGQIDAGAGITLPPGWDIVIPPAHEVGGDFSVFIRQTIMEACMAAHAPYELVTGDFSQTAERALRYYNKAIYEPVLQARRDMVESQFMNPVFREFVKAAVESGKWTPPAGETWEDHAEIEWAWQPIPHLQPLQEINAKVAAAKNGMKSISGAIRELGFDPDEVAQELREDMERFKGLPVDMWLNAQSAMAARADKENGGE
tara:strand:- start:2162 stop:3676 length:1515 start_codon:yes stop_codon:yes gene_type:complete